MKGRTAILDRPRAKHNELVAQLNRATLKRDEALERLIRADAKRNSLIRAVSRSQKRLAKAATLAAVTAPIDLFHDDSQVVESPNPHVQAMVKQIDDKVGPATDDLGIPAFLDRRKVNEADEKAKAQIIAQQEATTKKKAGARIAKLKADKSGERKRMPLSGKAAQDFLNQA